MGLSTRLKAKVDSIPEGEDGFWKNDCRETFHGTCERLVGLGMSEEDAVELLTGLYWAVASEFGA